MKIFHLVIFISAFFSAPALYAGYISTGTLRLDEVIKYAQKNNPEIKSAEKKWRAAKQKITQARSLADPQVSYETDSGIKMNSYGVSQEFPFFGKRYLRGRVARYEADIAESGVYRAKELEIISKVKTAYYMLLTAVKSVEIYGRSAELMKGFIKSAEAKYVVGQASQSDVLRAQVELSKMLNMLLVMRQEKESAEAMLNILLNREIKEPLGAPVEPETIEFNYSFTGLEKRALENRPELKSAKQSVEKSKSSLILAKTEYLPDFMLAYKRQYTQDTGDFMGNSGMVSLNLPLWFWKQGAMVKEAKQEKGMAEYEYTAMRNMTRYDLKNLFTKTQAYGQIVNQYKTVIIPLAQQNLEVSEAGYKSDKTGFLELIDSQRTLLSLQIEYYQYLADYEKFLAELERAAGAETIQ